MLVPECPLLLYCSHCFTYCSRRKPAVDDKADPGQSLMKMMQQMYDEGDDEMKKTIAKSWYESQEKRKAEGYTEGGMGM